MDFISMTINGVAITKLVHQESGAVIFNALPYRFIKGLYSSRGDAYFDTGVSNMFKFKMLVSLFPIDARGLIGFNAGKGSYFGSVRSDYNYQLEQNTIDLTDSRILSEVEFRVENTWVKLTTVGGELTTTGRVVVSDNFFFPRNIGSSYQTSIYFEEATMSNIDDSIISTFKPCILEQDIENGSAGQVGLWNVTTNTFVPHSSPAGFCPVETAVDGEYEEIYGARAVNGAYLDLMNYLRCNDNFDVEMTTAPYRTGAWQSDGVRRYTGTASVQINQTGPTDGAQVRFSIIRNNDTNYLVTKSIPENTRFRIHTTNTTINIDDDTEVVTENRGNNECQLTTMLFGVNNAGERFDRSSKVLHKFYVEAKDGTPKTHVVPAKIKSTGEILFVDKVRNIYLRNADTAGTDSYFEEVIG